VRAVADALNAAGYEVTLIGDDYTGPAAIDPKRLLIQRLSVALTRGLDQLVTSSSYFKQMESVDWHQVAAVICYPGSAALILRLMHSCRRYGVPLIIDCVEWFDPGHLMRANLGPYALDSEFRMRWLQKRVGNVICISAFLAEYYRGKGCNVIRVPPLVGKGGNAHSSGPIAVSQQSANDLNLVYAGFPSQKELFAEIVAGVRASRQRGINVSLRVVGITADELLTIVRNGGGPHPDLDGIACYGRLPRQAALQIVAESDFTVILRPQERFANAGFPSKLVESLSLGVPVMANATSDIAEYLRDGRDGYLLGEATATALEEAIVRASRLSTEQRNEMRMQASAHAQECFNYQNYAEPLAEYISTARRSNR
jgi:glycosyltransferase involved in cell wall biosynthesis